jgi:hypothetical protein
VLNDRGASEDPHELEALDAWGEVEENFDTISVQAWNAVLAQIFKVFVLGRVTVKGLKSLPGANALELAPEATMVGSNYFSVAECCLMAWMSAHATREFGAKARRVTNFDTGGWACCLWVGGWVSQAAACCGGCSAG